MNLSDLKGLNNLDPNNIGSWPAAAKAIIIALLCAVILGAGYYLDTSNQVAELEKARQKEKALKEEFETKQAKAGNLEAYKKQMAEIQRSFGALLQQLPGKTEVAALLVDINRVGIQSGLDFELFKPEAEVPKEFYAEAPIKIRVKGDYHQFGKFVSGIAALPRIVTLHDLALNLKKEKDGSSMTLETTAKTYRYLERAEMPDKRERASEKGKGKTSSRGKK
jgi:type IV pilus assembly protein PilO